MFNMIRVKRSETEPKSLLDGFVIKEISYVNSASTDGVFFDNMHFTKKIVLVIMLT